MIDFVAPMPGFPRDRRFVLIRMDDTAMLYSLASLDTEGLRFLVVPPAPFFPDYAPEIDEATVADLCGLVDGELAGELAGKEAVAGRVDPAAAASASIDPADLLVLLVVSAPTKAADATVNLLAPIVLHQKTRRATQLVLTGSGYPVREPLLIHRGESGGSAPVAGSAGPAEPTSMVLPVPPSAPPASTATQSMSPAAVAARIAASVAAKSAAGGSVAAKSAANAGSVAAEPASGAGSKDG